MNPKQVRPSNEDIALLSRFLIYFSINLAKVNFLSIFWRERALGIKLFAFGVQISWASGGTGTLTFPGSASQKFWPDWSEQIGAEYQKEAAKESKSFSNQSLWAYHRVTESNKLFRTGLGSPIVSVAQSLCWPILKFFCLVVKILAFFNLKKSLEFSDLLVLRVVRSTSLVRFTV